MAWTHTRARIARAIRDNPSADVTDLRRQLRAERLEEHIKTVVNQAPPLTAEQRQQLARVLASNHTDSATALASGNVA